MTETKVVGTDNGRFWDDSLKSDKEKCQRPVEGNWHDERSCNNSDEPALIMPVMKHNLPGQESGFF